MGCIPGFLQASYKTDLHMPMWMIRLQHSHAPRVGNLKERFFCDDVSPRNHGFPDRGYSYSMRFFQIGLVILVLHDANDVVLEADKVFKYSWNEVGASVLFGLVAISWVILRLVFFPFRVIRASSYYFVEHVPLTESFDALRYYVFNTLLLSLLLFHIYWWVLIYSMIMRQLKNSEKLGEDIRSGKSIYLFRCLWS